MSELKKIAGEILDHLHRYRQVGVRLAANAPLSTRRKPVSSLRLSTPRRAHPREASGDDPKISLFAEPTTMCEEMKTIRTDLGECQRCKLAPTRTNIVFGTGDPHAELMSSAKLRRRRRRAGLPLSDARAIADEDHPGDGYEARGRLYLQHFEMQAAVESQPGK